MSNPGISRIGGPGRDILVGGKRDNTLDGKDGDDELHGRGGDDTMIGGPGVDTLYGGTGGDTYKYNRGDGQDHILDRGFSSHDGSGDDVLEFGRGISIDDLVLQKEGTSLAIYVTDRSEPNTPLYEITDVIRIVHWHVSSEFRIETFRLYDDSGSQVDYDVSDLILEGEGPEEKRPVWKNGTTGEDPLAGFKGNDFLFGRGGKDELYGYEGDDRLWGGEGEDTLDGGLDNDVLRGGAGGDTLIGGEGDDTLRGGEGNDTYIFKRGHGEDEIIDTASSPDGDSGGDALEFDTGITLQDLVLKREGDDLKVYITDAASSDKPLSEIGNVITIRDWATAANRIETFRFTDAEKNVTEYDLSGLTTTLFGTGPGNPLNGDDDVNWMNGSADADEINGGKGGDFLFGRGGNDILRGGEGDDVLHGGAGNDTYVFKHGHGEDEIIDTASSPDGDSGGDAFEFDTGITLEDLVLKREGDDLKVYITDAASSDKPLSEIGNVITIRDWATAANRIETFRFTDAEKNVTEYDLSGLTTTLFGTGPGNPLNGDDDVNWMNGSADADEINGGKGSDFLFGRGGNDVLRGGEGEDVLHGGAGDDTYVFKVDRVKDETDDTYVFEVDHGKDEIHDTGSSPDDDSDGDTLEFRGGITLEDLVLEREGADLKVYVKADNSDVPPDEIKNVITIKNWESVENRIETFRFTDAEMNATDYNLSGLVTTIRGPGSDETLSGDNDGNWIDGTAEGEKITGGMGDDFILGRGGADNIRGGKENDTIFGGKGGDTINGDKGDDDIFGGEGVDEIEGGEGSDDIFGGEGGDNINGNQGEDKIFGGRGEDSIRGGKDGDTIDGGEDKDTIYGDLGNDTYIASAGADTYTFRSGDGQDTYKGSSEEGISDTDTFVFELEREEEELEDLLEDILFEREDNDLLVSLRDSSDRIRFEDWWASEDELGGHIDRFEVDNRILSHDKVERLLELTGGDGTPPDSSDPDTDGTDDTEITAADFWETAAA